MTQGWGGVSWVIMEWVFEMKWEKIYWTFHQSMICLLLIPASSMLPVILPLLLVGERIGVLVTIVRRPFPFILRLTSFCAIVHRSKPLLKDCRTYVGTLTYSDHRLVVTRVNFKDICLCYKRHSSSVRKFNTSELASNLSIQTKYRQTLESTLSTVASLIDPNEDRSNLLDSMKNAAVKSDRCSQP